MNKDKVWVSSPVFIFFQHTVLVLLTSPATRLLINSVKKYQQWSEMAICFGTSRKAFGAVHVSLNRPTQCDSELFKHLFKVLIQQNIKGKE